MDRMLVGGLMLVFLAGCAGATMPMNAIEGGPGQAISVAVAGLESSELPIDREGGREYVLQIEVSNNSNLPVTVTRITVGPPGTPQAFRIMSASVSFNEMIDPGEDYVFDIRLQGSMGRPFQPHESRTVEFRVTVSLADGDTYFYSFEGPVRF